MADEELLRVVAHVREGVRGFLEFCRGRFPEGNDLHLTTLVHIEIFDERNEVAIAGGDDDGVELGSELYRIDSEAHVPVGFLGTVGKDLKSFHFGFDTYLGEGIEERALFPAFRRNDVGDGAHDYAVSHGLFEDFLEVNATLIKVFGAVVEVLRIYENPNALRRMLDYRHKN